MHKATRQDRVWGFGPAKGDPPPPDPGHGPERDVEDVSDMFTARRLPTAKAALEPRLRCSEVDENGEVILVDGEFKKTELIAKACANHWLAWTASLSFHWLC